MKMEGLWLRNLLWEMFWDDFVLILLSKHENYAWNCQDLGIISVAVSPTVVIKTMICWFLVHTLLLIEQTLVWELHNSKNFDHFSQHDPQRLRIFSWALCDTSSINSKILLFVYSNHLTLELENCTCWSYHVRYSSTFLHVGVKGSGNCSIQAWELCTESSRSGDH